MGEEDVFSRKNFSCSLKCHSSQGKVFELKKEDFLLLKQSEHSWLAVIEKIIQKENKQQATHLCHSPRDFFKEDRIVRANLRTEIKNKI